MTTTANAREDAMAGAQAVAAALEEPSAASTPARARMRLSGVVARLTAANALNFAAGFVTGPLLARALGASGRGDLQAIIVPLSLTPTVLSFGISAYAYRSLPRGRSLDEVIGSLGLPLIAIGVVVAAASIPIADALAVGRHTVRTLLIIGLLMTPLAFLILLLGSSLAALERWRGVLAMNAIPFAVPLVATIVLYASGHLTVASAAIATMAASALAIVPALPLLARVRRPVFRPALARAGASFGLKSWLGGLAQTVNGRLDQLLMIAAVPPRQLGLYAVATTISMAPSLVTGAVSPPLMTRIGSGERFLMARAVRTTVILAAALNIVVGLATPMVLSILFGPQFQGAVPMAWVLLAASIPLAGATVLSTALQADGAPLTATAGEGIALIITIGGLVALLGPLQGMGAAIVSLAAYSTSFAFQLAMARRRVEVPLTQFIVPTRADMRWAASRVGDLVLRPRESS